MSAVIEQAPCSDSRAAAPVSMNGVSVDRPLPRRPAYDPSPIRRHRPLRPTRG